MFNLGKNWEKYAKSFDAGLNAHYKLYCQTNVSRFGQFPFVTSVNCSDYTYSIYSEEYHINWGFPFDVSTRLW